MDTVLRFTSLDCVCCAASARHSVNKRRTIRQESECSKGRPELPEWGQVLGAASGATFEGSHEKRYTPCRFPSQFPLGGARDVALDSGDVAWVIAATALVMIMTPALGFFYGGLVRRKNLVSTIAQCFAIFAVVSLVWALWGYTLALGPPFNEFIGSLTDFGLNNVGTAPNLGYSSTIPELLYFAFQLKFAAITPALIIGAFAERIRFKALLIYIVLWTTFVYVPIAHWKWGVGGGGGQLDAHGRGEKEEAVRRWNCCRRGLRAGGHHARLRIRRPHAFDHHRSRGRGPLQLRRELAGPDDAR